ncbi:hypothetical protein TNCV_2269681 [Trichonephila clavipes]|nr:hypothetical protein TNCV_2269681 [Trichonephila clavipes]
MPAIIRYIDHWATAVLKRVANSGRREDVGVNSRVTAPANRIHPVFDLFVVLTIMMKIKDRDMCNIVTFVHPSSMRNV